MASLELIYKCFKASPYNLKQIVGNNFKLRFKSKTEIMKEEICNIQIETQLHEHLLNRFS